jgi:uncharacterized glyoxalase superfamily protein PhnB
MSTGGDITEATPCAQAGFRSVTPYLIVDDVPATADFLKAAFAAIEIRRSVLPTGAVSNVQMLIGDSIVLASKPTGIFRAMPCTLYLYVADVDAIFASALAAGGTTLAPVEDKFYGDRNGCVRDPFGNHWWIATHREDVAPDEFARRAAALAKA